MLVLPILALAGYSYVVKPVFLSRLFLWLGPLGMVLLALGVVHLPSRWRLPATAYVEEEGHFTNFEGRVQKYEQALAPLGHAKPDHAIFAGLKAPARQGARAK